MASYPDAIKTFTNPDSDSFLNNPPHDQQHADANNEITAIETELGLNASGGYDDVAARLTAIEASITSEDIWDRTGTTIEPKTANDDLDLGSGAFKTTGNLDDGSNQVTISEAKDAYDHSQVTTGNPHSVSKSDVSLGSVTNDAQVKKAASSTDDTLPKWKGTSGDELEDSSVTEADAADAVSKKHSQNTDTGTSSDTFDVGDGTDTTKSIRAANGDANKPEIRYNHTGNEWEYSNNGTDFSSIGSGGSATRDTFDDGDLSSGELTISHSLGLSAPYSLLIQIYDNNGKIIIPDDVTGTTNSHTVDLTSYGTISGTWGYIYSS